MQIVSRTQVYPSRPLQEPKEVALSIVDATTARFAPTAAFWVYNVPIDESRLKTSLSKVLDDYPHWTGHLQTVTSDIVPSDHTRRYGRLFVTYGTKNDPGVEFTISTYPESISSFIPEPGWRNETGRKYWNAAPLPVSELVPTTPLAVHSGKSSTPAEPLPCMTIQVTSFACKSVSIAVKMVHPLADAHSLMYFMRDWAAIYCSVISLDKSFTPSPLFNPRLLDAASAGNIDSPELAYSLVERSRTLPCHRYDWFNSSHHCPDIILPSTVAPESWKKEAAGRTREHEEGDPMPWHEWDVAAPVEHYIFHFSRTELSRLYEIASSQVDKAEENHRRISYLDALLAHIWYLINRARFQNEQGPLDTLQVHLNQTLSLRGPRLSTNLPDNFIGSPIQLACVTSSASSTPQDLAKNVRTVLTKFDASSLAARLYERAMESGPPWRIWNAFLGERNVIVTSDICRGDHASDGWFDTGCGCAVGEDRRKRRIQCRTGCEMASKGGSGCEPSSSEGHDGKASRGHISETVLRLHSRSWWW